MMTEKFRDCFVGEKGYEALKTQMKTSSDISYEFAKCLQDRYDAELIYARSLRKISDNLHKLSGRGKGTLLQAVDLIATQMNKEGDAHSSIANSFLQQISIPVKELADTQAKDRKTIEDTLNGKLKCLKDKRDIDNKYRTRHFEKSKEIESLYIKATESTKSSRNHGKELKEGIRSTPLVSCVLPNGRYSNTSEKSTTNSDVKYQMTLDATIQKAEEDLEKIDRKYHNSTKDVELARQLWDAEFCRSCDQMEKMELDRLMELEKAIQSYTRSMGSQAEISHQIASELCSIRVSPTDDLVFEAKSNTQTTEIELLLYDIYAETDGNMISEQRRILSLMRWMEFLQRDIECQQHSIDDVDVSTNRFRDASSSSSNDDDGAMRHHRKGKKCDKKNKEDTESINPAKSLSKDIIGKRQSVYLFQYLYRGSLYKIEKVYNSIKNLPQPIFEFSNHFASTSNDKGYPTTLLRVPFQPMTRTPPSAPCTTHAFAAAMPMFVTPQSQPMPMFAAAQTPAIPMGYMTQRMGVMSDQPEMMVRSMNTVQYDFPTPATRQFIFPTERRSYAPVTACAPAYSNRQPLTASPSPQIGQEKRSEKLVRARYPYVAKHDDELTISPGDIIVLLKRRPDEWCKGNLHGKTGLFPENYVEDV